MTKAMIVENYRRYRSNPTAPARDVLYRMVVESLSENEREVFDALLEADGVIPGLMYETLTYRLPHLEGQMRGLLRRLVKYGLVVGDAGPWETNNQRMIYRQVDFLSDEPIQE